MNGHARAGVAQQPPPTSLVGFPTLLPPRRRLWRAGRSIHANPWWFDGSGGGRFNPVDTHLGSCYMGMDRLAGLMEVLGPEMVGGAVHIDDLAARSVFFLDPTHLPVPLADLAHRRAAGHGVTNELSTTPYDLPQQWAAALAGPGFQGVRYRTRFDTGAGGVAVFGSPGLNPFHWPVPPTPTPAAALRARLTTTCGITVIETPSLNALPSAPPP